MGLEDRVWTRVRARREGVSVARLTGGAEFVRVVPGRYVEACWADDLPTRCAAVVHAAPAAVLSHWTALELRDVPAPVRGDGLLHVTVPAAGPRPRWRGVAAHRAGPVRPFLATGLPVSGVVRAWCDAASLLGSPGRASAAVMDPSGDAGPDLADLVAAGDVLAARRQSTPLDVRRQLSLRPGCRGSAVAASALTLLDGRAESAMESRLRVVLALGGLPPPAVQHEVRGRDGRFVARVDLAYPGSRVAVEYDGDHHRERRQWRADLVRREALEALGWRVVVVTARDLLHGPVLVVARVRRAIARG